jgi:hypothetical protein
VDPIDAVGRIADDHVRALLLHDRGADRDEIAAHLGIDAEAVADLLAVAGAKLTALEAHDRCRPGTYGKA